MYEPMVQGGGWYDVVDVKQIVGFMPLVPNFENGNNTIPKKLANKATSCFPAGQAGTKGSKLWRVNALALAFGCRDAAVREENEI